MKTRRAKSTAFTLTELMVVIVIIAVLMALLLPAILKARGAADKARAKAKISTISLALDAFQRDFGYYPPTANAFNVNSATGGRFDGDAYGDYGYSEALVQCLCNRFTKGVGDAPAGTNNSLRGSNRIIGMAPVTSGPYLEVKAEDLADADGDGFPELVDPWRNPYIYIPRDDYFQSDGVTYNAGAQIWNDLNGNGVVDAGELGDHYNRFKFQLISLGPDGWTPGLYYPLEPGHNGRYWNITALKPGNANPAPYLVGTDDVLTAPATDANHTNGTADDLNNWR